MTKNYKKLGFTLAELVLSMAIIGTIAILALPIITGKAPNKEMIMFKKSYGVLSKTIIDILNDEDLYPTGSLSDTSEVVYNGVSYSGNDKFCGLLTAHLITQDSTCKYGTGGFTTVDGIYYNIVPKDGFYYVGIDVYTTPIGDKTHCRLGIVHNMSAQLGQNICSSTAVKGTQFIVRVNDNGGIFVSTDSVEDKYLKATDNTKKYSEL